MRISDWSSDVCSSDLSQAASSAARPDAAETALSIFEACERRGIVDRQDAFVMRGILLAGRRFEQARRFIASHPDASLSALPAFEVPPASDAQATVWRMTAERNRLTRTATDLPPTPVLVPAGSPLPADAAG